MAYPSPKGTIRGTHHLTFCVGGAQEDYDFHVKTLGLKMVKKTVLFDGEVPIYHLYYGNEVGNASTLLTSFPYRQAGWMGKRGTQQALLGRPSQGRWHLLHRDGALRRAATRVRAPVGPRVRAHRRRRRRRTPAI